MTSPVPFKGRLLRIDQRTIERRRLQAQAALDEEMAATLASAEHEAARVDGIGLVTQRAMWQAAKLSSIEDICSGISPSGVNRLQAIADAGSVALLGVVGDTERKIQ